jgi:predicted outer membrane lipoprotein
MDVSTTSFSPTQVIFAWILLALLVSWFIIFTALALRDYVMKKVKLEDIPTPSRPIPIIGNLQKTEQHNFVEMAGSTQHYELDNSEGSNDSGTTLFT